MKSSENNLMYGEVHVDEFIVGVKRKSFVLYNSQIKGELGEHTPSILTITLLTLVR